ncbi:MAG: RNA polymerase sigma factor [Sterolibacteriaceae bacterium MAG5]|nr:RNA polymerase sigma factor [Candidatus Nitricoxidireducens bremensis]
MRRFPGERGRLVAVLSRLVDRAEAEDLVQETLLRALSAIDGFRGEAALGTWLHRIAVNLAHDRLRLKSAAPAAALDAAPEAAVEEGAGETIDRRRMGDCVREVLAGLPASYRDVLTQADILDRGAAEIARASGITPGNAKIRLHRARRAMKAALEAECAFHRSADGILCCSRRRD